MKAKDRRELIGWGVGLIAGLQAMADCILLRIPDNITSIIVIVVMLAVGSMTVRGLDRLAELTRKPVARRRNKVRMYNLKETATPDWPMVEIN